MRTDLAGRGALRSPDGDTDEDRDKLHGFVDIHTRIACGPQSMFYLSMLFSWNVQKKNTISYQIATD